MSVGFDPVASVRDTDTLVEPHDVEYQDGIAYVPGKGGTFALVDVRAPEPRVLGALTDFENAQTVLPVGNYALVADDAGVHAVDCSTPTEPVVRATAADDGLTRINGVARWRSTLFCACKGGYVHAIDISALPSLSVVGRYDADADAGLNSPHDIAVVRDHLVVPNQMQGTTPKLGAVRAIDTAANDLLDPAEWSASSTVSASTMDGANRVVVRHPYLFVANNYGHTVTAVDATDLAAMERVGECEVAAREPDGLALAGDYLLAGAEDTIEAFDVRDPTDPTSAAVHRFEQNINAHDLEVVGDTVYLTGQGTAELHLLSLGGASGSDRLDALHLEGSGVATDLRVSHSLDAGPT
ncbi:MAG: hypothetical protein ABEH77_01865 [Halobacteriaceae archaeon]